MKITIGKRTVFMSLIFIGLIAAISFYTGQHFKDKRHENTENEDGISDWIPELVSEDKSEVMSVSAEELMSHYRRDAYGANKKYSDASIQPGVPRPPLLPGHAPKSIIVKGKIKRIDKKELSYSGFVNQFKTTVVLWGEDSAAHIVEFESSQIISDVLEDMGELPLKTELGGDEVRCSFNRDQTFSLRDLNTDDFVEIRGNVVSNSLGKYRSDYINFFFYLSIEECVLVKHASPTKEVPHE